MKLKTKSSYNYFRLDKSETKMTSTKVIGFNLFFCLHSGNPHGYPVSRGERLDYVGLPSLNSGEDLPTKTAAGVRPLAPYEDGLGCSPVVIPARPHAKGACLACTPFFFLVVQGRDTTSPPPLTWMGHTEQARDPRSLALPIPGPAEARLCCVPGPFNFFLLF